MDGVGHLLNIKKIGYICKEPFSVIAIFLKHEVTYIWTLIQEFVKKKKKKKKKKIRIYSFNLSVYETHSNLNTRVQITQSSI